MFRPNIHTCRHSVRRFASNKSRNITFFSSSSPTRIRNKMNYPATEITLQKNEKNKIKTFSKYKLNNGENGKTGKLAEKKAHTHTSRHKTVCSSLLIYYQAIGISYIIVIIRRR